MIFTNLIIGVYLVRRLRCRCDRHELGVHRDDNDGRRRAGRRMVAEAELGGGVAETVHHLRQGGGGAGEEWHSPTNARPVLHGRGGVAVAAHGKSHSTANIAKKVRPSLQCLCASGRLLAV